MKSSPLLLLTIIILVCPRLAHAAPDATEARRSLTELEPLSAEQSFGELQVNYSVEGKPLTVAGRHYAHGLGTHAHSQLVYELNARFDRFESWAGVDDEMTSFGKSSVIFKVFGDDHELFESGILRNGSPPCHIVVSVTGYQELRLEVTDAGDGINGDHADWLEPTLLGEQLAAKESPDLHIACEVSSPELKLQLSAQGEMIGMVFEKTRTRYAVRGRTRLGGFHDSGEVILSKTANGIEFTRTVTNRVNRQCTITDRFSRAADAIEWDVELQSDGTPWTAPIITTIHCEHPEKKRLWAAWQDPLAPVADINYGDNPPWHDPLIGQPFTTRSWSYGEPPNGQFCSANIISLPLVSIWMPEDHNAFTLVQSPEDTLLDLHLRTTEDGEIEWQRLKYRMGGGKTIRFRMQFIAHEDDWRQPLAWLEARYPEFFEPPNPHVQKLAGTAAYTGEEKPVDLVRMRRMAFRTLWKLSDDYAYMGMFLPPLTNSDARWQRTSDSGDPPGYKPQWTSFRRLNDFARYLRTNGFYLLNYFNTTEFGKHMKEVAVSVARAGDPDLWKDASAYLAARMPHAPVQPRQGAWQGGWAVDPGDPDYMNYLIEQAERHLKFIPDAAGICIDRADYLHDYNHGGDDGISWDGQPSRALVISWRDLLERLGPLMHEHDKVIFCNLLDPRLEITPQIDGIYAEYGDRATVLNGVALLCLHKPLLVWTRNQDKLDDDFFQRNLYLGAFPTAPYPLNNHSIQPSPERDRWYLDYGPLFDCLRGKRWVLTPRCIEIMGNAAKANLFEVDDGWVAPVVFAGTNVSATVKIRGILGGNRDVIVDTLHPGSNVPERIQFTQKNGQNLIELRVPLQRGCALIHIKRY